MFEGCRNHTFDLGETWTWKCIQVFYFGGTAANDLYWFLLTIADCAPKVCFLRKNETCDDVCGNEEAGIKLLNDGTEYPTLKVCVICEECGSCQTACQVGCEISCEVGCEVACQSTCELSSQFCGRECSRGLNR